MAAKRSNPKPKKPCASVFDGVDAFIDALDHPRKSEILALRRIILGADPSIGEGIKWNAPSFHTSEHFATFQLRAKDGVQIIFHLGAKPRAGGAMGIADPESLLTWLGENRASVMFRDMAEVDEKRAAFVEIIRQWITHV